MATINFLEFYNCEFYNCEFYNSQGWGRLHMKEDNYNYMKICQLQLKLM